MLFKGAESIPSHAYRNCHGLKTVQISASVTTIGEEAFAPCRGFRSSTIPDSVVTIENAAFMGVGCHRSRSLIQWSPSADIIHKMQESERDRYLREPKLRF